MDRDRVFAGSPAGDIVFRGNGGDAEGFAGGAQMGYNWQFTPGNGFVVGVEADIQGIDLDRDTSNTSFTFVNSDGGVLDRSDFLPLRRSAASLDYFGTVLGLASVMLGTASWFTAPAALLTAAAA